LFQFDSTLEKLADTDHKRSRWNNPVLKPERLPQSEHKTGRAQKNDHSEKADTQSQYRILEPQPVFIQTNTIKGIKEKAKVIAQRQGIDHRKLFDSVENSNNMLTDLPGCAINVLGSLQ